MVSKEKVDSEAEEEVVEETKEVEVVKVDGKALKTSLETQIFKINNVSKDKWDQKNSKANLDLKNSKDLLIKMKISKIVLKDNLDKKEFLKKKNMLEKTNSTKIK